MEPREPYSGRPFAQAEAKDIRQVSSSRASRWGVILAGGDGKRLHALTLLISGDERPKQFCPLTSDATVFEETRKRAEETIPSGHLLVSLTSSHSSFFSAENGISPRQRIVQPANKGTAPPIVCSLLSIEQKDMEAMVAILPCDHYYANEQEFTIALESAFNIAARHSESVVLLGATPRGPDVEHGWIELGPSVGSQDTPLFQVGGFCEKPSFRTARELFESGALWNTFVMVGRVRAFLSMARAVLPDMETAFRQSALWSGVELHIDPSLYDGFNATDFSRDVLSAQAAKLVVLRTDNTGWSDLSRPERVLSVLREAGLQPHWMKPRQRLDFHGGIHEADETGPAQQAASVAEVAHGI